MTIRYAVEVYATSDKLDAETCITLRSPVPLPAVQPDLSLPQLFKALKSDAMQPLLEQADDWRLMTPDEAADYRDRN